MSSKYLYCSSNDSNNHANFRVNFPEPVVVPKNAQIRLINCRLNLEDEDVIILLDGDDWFASSQTLTHLNSYYSDNSCWLTYGSYILFPMGIPGPEPSEYPEDVINNNTYRKDSWRASHLRTFRRHLWDRLDPEDLKDDNGEFYKMTYDQAIMLPLLEMAGDRCKYIPEILHVYNKQNPLNVDKIKAAEQAQLAQVIRSKKPYERV
mgnify:CR=1 FL=1